MLHHCSTSSRKERVLKRSYIAYMRQLCRFGPTLFGNPVPVLKTSQRWRISAERQPWHGLEEEKKKTEVHWERGVIDWLDTDDSKEMNGEYTVFSDGPAFEHMHID